MIAYIEDKNEQYKEDILLHLREHNHQYTNPKKDNIAYNVYVYNQSNDLIGAWQASSSWDWVNTSQLFYENRLVLQHLIYYGYKFYQDKVTGIKCFTTVKSQLNDMIDVGFTFVGMVQGTPQSGDTYYADLTSLDSHFESIYNVVTTTEKLEIEDTILKAKVREFNKAHKIEAEEESISFVALDGERFAGGVTCEIYQDSIYVHLLAVNKDYRGDSIGSTLMHMVEAEARKRQLLKITLGTAEFQARGFYEKLGYKVVFTRKDNPKGYECYTLEKDIA